MFGMDGSMVERKNVLQRPFRALPEAMCVVASVTQGLPLRDCALG